MALYDYEEEVKNQITSNILKIAVPIIMPLYLLFNINDWLWYPNLALEFLLIRFSIIPAGALCFVALKKKWSGPWHVLTVWICAFTLSCQLTYMAFRSGGFSVSPYLHAVNLIAAAILFLFPMQPWRNVGTLAAIYTPPGILFFFLLAQRKLDHVSFALLVLYFMTIAIFSIAASTVNRLRYKTFQQKVSLFYMATTDALSGLKLRRYFFNRFVQELSLRVRKSGETNMSAAMMDIDSFKEINDQYGHVAGDRVIRHIGEVIRKNIRIYDVACRFGGEEFAVLFPETKPEEALSVCERIRAAVADSVIKLRGRDIRITLSGGVAGSAAKVPEEFRQALMSSDKKTLLIKHMLHMIREADSALYEAKKKRKNCVCLGKTVEFSISIDTDEITMLKSYLPYFEESVFQLVPDEAVVPVEAAADSFFYPEEYFFRRCVEGLYRWHRDPAWREVLAVISIDHPNQELVKRQFHRMFRLADATSILGAGLYGVLFYEMPQWALERVLERVKRQLAQVMRVEQVPVRIAAAPLQFDTADKPSGNPAYSYFAKKSTELFNHLKQHRFQARESIYYFEPSSLPIPAAKA
jgi:diguanylate cyclase (GGDEF)-like protein